MKGRSLTQQTIIFLITVIILYSVTAIVPRLISTYFTTYFYLAVMGLCLLLLLISRGKKSIDEYVILIIPFLFWYALMYLVSKPSLTDWVYKIILDFIPIVIGLYVLKRCDHALVRVFSVVIIVAIVATMITTYTGIQTYPDAARYLATVSNPNDSLFVKYNMANIGGYEFIYTVCLLYPVAIYAYKKRRINAFFMFAISASILILVIESSYTTAFLMWFVSSILLFFKREFKAQFLILIAVVAVLIFAVFADYISDGLRFLSTKIDNKDMSERLRDLAGGREGLAKSEDPRWEQWMRSITDFIKYPLLGNMTSAGGGHSFILDTLAEYGLLGATLVGIMYTIIFRKFFLPFKTAKGYGYVVWSFIQTLILSLVNTGMWLYVLCLFMPTLFAFIDKGERKNEGSLGREFDPERLKSGAVRQTV